KLLPGDAVVLHRLDDRLDELLDLLRRGRAGGSFDPREGVTDVFFWNPRAVPLDLETDITLLEKNRPAVAAQHGIAQAGLESVPARRQRAGDVTHVLVVHAEHGAEPMLFHHCPRALDPVLAQPVPVDPLLPIHAGNAEIRSHGPSSPTCA